MRKLSKVCLLAPVVLSAACYHAIIETGRPAGTTILNKTFQSSFIYGLVPPPPLNASGQCPSGVARVETQHRFVEGLVAALTLGIYTPMTLTVTCASGGSSALPGERVIEVGDRGGVDARQAALAEAARLSVATGNPVYVRF